MKHHNVGSKSDIFHFTMRVLCSAFIAASGNGVAAHSQTTDEIVKWDASFPKVSVSNPIVRVTVVAHIENGWHIYSPTQSTGGPIPMSFRVPEGKPFLVIGQPRQGIPMKRRDENFQMETEVFEKTAKFKLSVKKAQSEIPVELPIDVRFQVCNASLCLPPTIVHLEAKVVSH